MHRTAHRPSRCVLLGGTFRAPQSFAAGGSSADPPDPTFLIPALCWNTPPLLVVRPVDATKLNTDSTYQPKTQRQRVAASPQPCVRKGARGSVATLKQGSRFDHPVSVHFLMAPVYSEGPLYAESDLRERLGC